MSLIRWRNKTTNGDSQAGGSSLTRFRSEMDRLFDRFFQDPWFTPTEMMTTGETWVPSLDIADTDHEITIRAEIPGVDPKDVDVSVSGNYLTISGEKCESSEQKEQNYYHCERRFGSFRRSVELPATADAGKVAAEHSNGVLTVHVPKQATAKPRHVEVKSGAPAPQSKRVPVETT
jgi:HSP20 family protein